MKEFSAIPIDVYNEVLEQIIIVSRLVCNKISPAVTVIFRFHDMYSDSILHQVAETLSVSGVVGPEQFGCIYFQGHIRV